MSNTSSHKSNGWNGKSNGWHDFAPTVVIREARDSDGRALRAVAQRDSARVPEAPLLVADLSGALLAAISLSDGSVVADPFQPTAELVSLLEARASQLRGPGSKPSGTPIS